MSVFGSIMNKIFHRGTPAAPPAPPVVTASAAPAPAPAAAAAPAAPALVPAAPAPAARPAAATPPAAPVDVEAVLTALAAKLPHKLDWRRSIVDLMKLLDLDSSLANRKALAAELHYSGDTNDSATMNVWLHKQVMTKLAENGGKVPADLRD